MRQVIFISHEAGYIPLIGNYIPFISHEAVGG